MPRFAMTKSRVRGPGTPALYPSSALPECVEFSSIGALSVSSWFWVVPLPATNYTKPQTRFLLGETSEKLRKSYDVIKILG